MVRCVQVPDQRKQAESYLQILGQSVDHISTCKVGKCGCFMHSENALL